MTADVIDLSSVLTSTAWSIVVRLVDQDLNATASSATFLATFFLKKNMKNIIIFIFRIKQICGLTFVLQPIW